MHRAYIVTIDCGFEMIDILHRTAVCGLVGVTIYGLYLIGRGTWRMEKARIEVVRLRKAENTDKVIWLNVLAAINHVG